MPIQPSCDDPKRLSSKEEIADVLDRILTWEEDTKSPSGVIELLRRQFGVIYYIVTDREADVFMKRDPSESAEFGLQYYPKSYFVGLLEKTKA